ncbi:MAG: 30S ribosome-binding factor RbfA [Deltaproteobacteria bacterium]|nr:30S ribosome-binding factor RbfA [Deltaproteobacteria bacterium]
MARKRASGGGSSSGSGTRPARVGELIRQELSDLFQTGFVRDTRFDAALVTVTGVEVSGDLQHAKAFVSVFSEDAETRAGVMTALGQATKALRRELGGRLGLRHTPELHFGEDASARYGERIERVLKEIKAAAPGDGET